MATQPVGVSRGRTVSGYKTEADLSSSQYLFAVVTDPKIIAVSGANGKSVGIIMNKPDGSTDGPKSVDIAGPGEEGILKISETVAVSKFLTSTSAGQGEVADAAGEFVGAIALQAGVVNDLIKVLVVAFTAHASDA